MCESALPPYFFLPSYACKRGLPKSELGERGTVLRLQIMSVTVLDKAKAQLAAVGKPSRGGANAEVVLDFALLPARILLESPGSSRAFSPTHVPPSVKGPRANSS